jgi:3-oxoacyl-[acyl-carrier protein] reductase
MTPPRTVCLTGGEGDLGQAMQQRFTEAGWRVLAPGRTSLDVTEPKSVEAYFATVSPLHVLINNAGCLQDQTLSRLTLEKWQAVIDVNLRGAFLCTQAVLPQFQRQQAGHVLFVGSRSARFGPVGQTNYAAAKAGLIGLAHSLAREHGQDNLQFNVVFPGFLETKMNHHLSPSQRGQILADHQLGRFNTVTEAARTLHFLATLENISGQVWQLDSRIDPWT